MPSASDLATEGLESYFNAAVESSDRSRKILLLLITASIIVFTAKLNTVSWSWQHARVDCHMAAVNYIDSLYDKKNEDNVYLKIAQLAADKNRTEASKAQEREKLLKDFQDHGYKCAHGYGLKLPFVYPIDPGKLNNKQEGEEDPYRTYHVAQQKLKNDAYWNNSTSVGIPVVGIKFDINDLGMVGGLAFVLLLLCFYYAIWHEKGNLYRLFAQIEKSEIEVPEWGGNTKSYLKGMYYRKLGMRQVFTTVERIHPDENRDPESEKRFSRTRRVLGRCSKALILLPFGIQAVVLADELTQWETGNVLDFWHYWIEMGVEVLLTFLILVLCMNILRITGYIDLFWDRLAEELKASESHILATS